MQTQATLEAFGAEAAAVHLHVTPRSTAWRLSRAAGLGLAGYSITILSILPPHLLWALAGIVTGTTFAVRKYLERYTLESLEGHCPHCEADVSHERSSRLTDRSTLTCDSCHRSSELVVDIEELDARRSD